MKMRHYLIVSMCAIGLFACKQKSQPSDSDSTSTAIAQEEADTAKAKKSDTSAVDMPGEKAVPLAQLIVPGTSLGQTAINETAENVHKRLGKPDDGDAAMGKSVSIWYADHNKKGYATHMYFVTDMGNDPDPRVKVIRVSSPSFKVNNKIYTGVLLKTAEELYKLKKIGTYKLNGSDRNIFDDEKAGIAFDADRSGTVTGIAVHETGKSPITAYMAFFQGVTQAQ
ncbi:hypothetical protein FPZ42_17770 [Mucilaginibacter achroorhodeus]|uniref:Lipoprotein n=1 Tax=Mucilaginibacter achroorhodeus TaxID=2599294 RepID=A0A563TY90_9SPHI|nr:hypothetical protein [Mucilaginibacter achroorhodeus]TWR24325.1 hypothetical protein FPZ42_17770 [Mucilaginibacter achroorhodeus]